MSATKMKALPHRDRFAGAASSGYQFLKQLDGYVFQHFRPDGLGRSGKAKLDIANDSTRRSPTSFPVDEALPQASLASMCCRSGVDDKSDDYDSRATQWFVVSDIGLST